MSETIDLKAIKTNIYRTILEDGLLEIMIGIYFLLSGVFLHNRSMIWNYLWLAIAPVLIEIIRRRFIYPRSGYVKISLPTVKIVAIFGAMLAGTAVLAALIALLASSTGHPIMGNWREIISYALIFCLVISFFFIAYRFSLTRWYMHTISTGIVFLLGKAFDAPGLVSALGIWITLVGTYVFIRFMKQFPIEPDPVSDPDPREKGIPDAS